MGEPSNSYMDASEEGTAETASSRQRHRLLDSVKKAVFVIGTAVIVFIAFRNSLTWHAQRFWGASGDLWQTLFDKAHDWLGGDESTFWMFLCGTAIVTIVPYWIVNILLILLDITQTPQFLYQFKIQDTGKLQWDRLRNAIIRVLTNQTIVSFPVIVVIYWLMTKRGCDFDGELPTFPLVVWEMFIFIWVEEVGFYYSHRLSHHPKLYKHIHKIHHEWTAPIGIISLYAHPIEHIVSNLLPPLLGPVLCGSHVATAWLWYMLALLSTSSAHSGYHFPFLPSPEAHDFHHLKFNQNYGVLGVIDRLHGTDNLFRKTKAYDRHFLLLSLVPVRSMMPDNQKKNVKDE